MKHMSIVMNKDRVVDEWTHLGNKIMMKTNIKPCLFKEGEITLLFDGILLNYITLYHLFYEIEYDKGTETNKLSLLIDIYIKCGIHYLLKVLDGSFTFVLLDQRVEYDESRLYIISDSMGLRPIYSVEIQSLNTNDNLFKTIYGINTENEYIDSNVSNLLNPGKMYVFKRTNQAGKYWELKKNTTYFSLTNSGGFPYIHLRQDIAYTLIHNYLYNAIEKRCLVSSHKHDLSPTDSLKLEKSNIIFCIVSNDDIESKLIAQMANSIGTNDEVVKISIDQLSDFSGSEEDKYNDENTIANFVYEKITEYLSKYTHTPINYHIFASSGMMNIEKMLQKQYNLSSIKYDSDFRHALWTIGINDLIPNIIEPFKRKNLEVEFPFLDTEWLNFYMTISPQYRYNNTMIENSLEEHI
jgi:asparagine synthetase B (glutamine-hydrolysing)